MLVFVAIVHVYFKKFHILFQAGLWSVDLHSFFYRSESISLLNADPDPENTICNNYFMES